MSIAKGEYSSYAERLTLEVIGDARMEVLDYIEDQAWRNASFRLETMEQLNKRVAGLVTLLLGGGGATGTYVLGKWAGVDSPYALWALGALSLWWFVLTFWLVVHGLCTQEVRPPAGDPGPLLSHFEGPLSKYVAQARLEGETVESPLRVLREEQIKVMQAVISEYQRNNTVRAKALDRVYRLAAFSPMVALLGALLAVAWRYCLA